MTATEKMMKTHDLRSGGSCVKYLPRTQRLPLSIAQIYWKFSDL
jgi:hypothetical protein